MTHPNHKLRSSEGYLKVKELCEANKIAKVKAVSKQPKTRVYLEDGKHFLVGNGVIKLLQEEKILKLTYQK